MPGSLEEHPNPWDMEMHSREAMQEDTWPKLAFIEHRFYNDPTNWFAPNEAAMKAMLRSAGMKVIGNPCAETYLAEPDPENPSSSATWNRGEYLSATGQTLLSAKP
jgi:tRNA (mo5U34)-methyltransferase